MNATQLKKSVSLLTVLFAASTSAMADHNDDYSNGKYQDYARVRNVTPEYQRVNSPRQECNNEYIRGTGYGRERVSSDRSYTGTVIGGIAGALVGSRFGKGNGNTAATAAGAIAGAVIGDKVQANNANNDRYAHNDDGDDDRGREVQRCHTVDNWENRLTGYRVVYEYAGRSYTTVMPNEPGRQIPVRVSVVPAVGDVSRNTSRW